MLFRSLHAGRLVPHPSRLAHLPLTPGVPAGTNARYASIRLGDWVRLALFSLQKPVFDSARAENWVRFASFFCASARLHVRDAQVRSSAAAGAVVARPVGRGGGHAPNIYRTNWLVKEKVGMVERNVLEKGHFGVTSISGANRSRLRGD